MTVYRVQVYLDGLRDTRHYFDGKEYPTAVLASCAASLILQELAVNEVLIVKVSDKREAS